jgi:hypothetical protein
LAVVGRSHNLLQYMMIIHGKGATSCTTKMGCMPAIGQDEEISECCEVRSATGVSDINGSRERLRDISFGFTVRSKRAYKAHDGGRFVVAQKPGLESYSIWPGWGSVRHTLFLAIKPCSCRAFIWKLLPAVRERRVEGGASS